MVDQWIQQLPKPLIAFLSILAAVFFFWVFNPPNTPCDEEKKNQEEALAGILYPKKIQKQVIAPQIIKSKSNCLQGNSSGACHEYFEHLRKILYQVSQRTHECPLESIGGTEVIQSLETGMEIFVLIAWGDTPPKTEEGERFQWLQDSELNLFCKMKKKYLYLKGEEAFDNLRTKITQKLPGEPPQIKNESLLGETPLSEGLNSKSDASSSKTNSTDLASEASPSEAPKLTRATDTLSENEIWEKSLLSLKCEFYE